MRGNEQMITVRIEPVEDGKRFNLAKLIMEISVTDFITACMIAHRGGEIKTTENHLPELEAAGLLIVKNFLLKSCILCRKLV